MAKDLPYFKFFVSEWNDGDITLEDFETQGLFINLCAYYWSNECEITLSKSIKKFRHISKDCFDNLISAEIIKVVDDLIIINFLDEQKEERIQNSKSKSKGGRASAEARRLKKLAENQQKLNTSSTDVQQVLNSCSTETQVLREEERREEKKREENKINKKKIDLDIIDLDVKCKELLLYWISYRRDINKPIKAQVTLLALAKKIKNKGFDISSKVINNSIENNYQGLFWDNVKETKTKPNRNIAF